MGPTPHCGAHGRNLTIGRLSLDNGGPHKGSALRGHSPAIFAKAASSRSMSGPAGW